MNVWYPIETAPKDETSVLLYCPEKRDTDCMGVAFWSDDENMEGGGGWFDDESASNPVTDLGWGAPTHWARLPEPPK